MNIPEEDGIETNETYTRDRNMMFILLIIAFICMIIHVLSEQMAQRTVGDTEDPIFQVSTDYQVMANAPIEMEVQ